MKNVHITVYGAEIVCASCVNAPSSIDTYEWLQAVAAQKYEAAAIHFEYVDIFAPSANEKHQAFSQKIQEEDLFYPVVVINDEIAGEGVIRIKPITSAIENALQSRV